MVEGNFGKKGKIATHFNLFSRKELRQFWKTRVIHDQVGFTTFASLWTILVEGNFGKKGKITTHFNLFSRRELGQLWKMSQPRWIYYICQLMDHPGWGYLC